jgi:hypothetical protein
MINVFDKVTYFLKARQRVSLLVPCLCSTTLRHDRAHVGTTCLYVGS